MTSNCSRVIAVYVTEFDVEVIMQISDYVLQLHRMQFFILFCFLVQNLADYQRNPPQFYKTHLY